jgi:sulfotransferase family protein
MGKIIWLASYPKSGNTWLRVFLHNLLRDPPEGYELNRIDDFTIGDSATIWYAGLIGRAPGDWSFEEVAKVRRKAHESMVGAFPDSVFVKTHNALLADAHGPMITMELTAGAIYVIRNPLDVVVSYSHHLGKTIDETIDILNSSRSGNPNTVKNVYQLLGSWSEHAGSWTARPHPSLHVMRYEDMLERPEATFGAVAAFLGLKPPRPRLLRAIERSHFKELRKAEDAQGFKERSDRAERFFRAGRAGQWREVLAAEQVRRLVDAHRPAMERFGYLPTG